MVSTRSLRIFNLYDVLGVFFPGTTLLVGVYVLMPGIPDPSSVVQYLGIIVVAFTTGHLLQSYSSFPTDDLKIFDATIKEVQKPLSSSADAATNGGDVPAENNEADASRTSEKSGDDEPVDSESEDDKTNSPEFEPIEESNWAYLNLFYPFIGPIWCLVDVVPFLRSWDCLTGTPNAGGLTDLQNPNRVWIELNTEYDFEPGQNRFDEMQQVISSRTDDPASPARSYRFQAIRNFQRGTWLAVWILFTTVVTTTVWTEVRHYLGAVAYSHPLAESYLFATLPLYIIAGGGLVGVLAFWWQTLQYERLFIRFLITDYVVLLNQADQVQRVQLHSED
jgi:hypothetical protein